MLDHVVIDVRRRMDEAAARYQALGFQLTERGRHTLGSINHLAMFAHNYLELLGFGDEGRLDIEAFPIGLNGLVFKTDDAEALYRSLAAKRLAVQAPRVFSRPLTVDGVTQDARFRTTTLEPRAVAFGRLYFCEHLTPELVWRPPWQRHPNGVQSIERVIVATADPGPVSDLLHASVDAMLLRADADGVSLVAGDLTIELRDARRLAEEFGKALADPAGRHDYLAVLGLRTASLKQSAEVLAARGIEVVSSEPDRLVVPAGAAMNVTLELRE
jgi:Glyoxalase-like domain